MSETKTTIGDYEVEYDRMGKPTFKDADGYTVPYTDLKGNELALANKFAEENGYFTTPVASGNTQDGKADLNLSKDRLTENKSLQTNGQAKDATPQEMAKINSFIDSLGKEGQNKINALRQTLSNFGTKAKDAIKAPLATIKAMKDKQSTH